MRWIRRRRCRAGSCRRSFAELRRQMEARLGKRGRREYVQVLRLLETFSMAEVSAAVRQALRLPAIAFDAIKHLLLCAIEQRPPRLDLENYPHLPLAEVALTRAADYQSCWRRPLMDTPQVLLEHYLKQLRLPTMVREFPKLAEQCAKEGAHLRAVPAASGRAGDAGPGAARHGATHQGRQVSGDQESGDLRFPGDSLLNKKLVVELARCEWIGRRENVLALGNSGTGKTHIGLALGLAACQQGFRVRFTTAASLVHELIEARDEKRLLRFQKNLATAGTADRGRTRFCAAIENRRRNVVRSLQPALRTSFYAGDQQSAVRRMDRGAGIRTSDRRPAGSADAPCSHPRNERRQLPAQEQ